MKNFIHSLRLLFFITSFGVAQNGQHIFPIIESYPMIYTDLNNYLPQLKLQFNLHNFITPQFNVNCPSIGILNTNYEVGTQLLDLSCSYSSVPDTSLYMCPYQDYINYVFDENGNVSYYIYGQESVLYALYTYNDNQLLESYYNDFYSPLSPGISSVENNFTIDWYNYDSCLIYNNGTLASRYEFNDNGDLISYFNYDSLNLNMQLEYFPVIDSVHFNYNESNKIIRGDVSFDNGGKIICDYEWIDDLNVEMSLYDINSNQYGISNLSKVYYRLDSNNYITQLTRFDTLSNETDSYEIYSCNDTSIFGCIDSFACNFNPLALIEDSTCIYSEMFYNCEGVCINDFDLDGECDEVDYNDGIGIDELDEGLPQVIKMIDILGREQREHKKGSLLFYIYDNGVVEKLLIN